MTMQNDLCRMRDCSLIGLPQYRGLCEPHYMELHLSRSPRSDLATTATPEANSLPNKTNHTTANLMPSEGSFGRNRDKSRENKVFVNTDLDPNSSSSQSSSMECRNENCQSPGTKEFDGHCATCYLMRTVMWNGDTAPLDEPNKEHPSETTNKEAFENTSRVDAKCENKSQTVNSEEIKLTEQLSTENENQNDIGEIGSKTATHEFHKCREDGCNKLAPNGTDGLCTDCYERSHKVQVQSKSISQQYDMKQGKTQKLQNDASSRESDVKFASLQSAPSMSIKYQIKRPPPDDEVFEPATMRDPLASPTKTTESEPPRCSHALCSGLAMKGTDLCFTCLKLKMRESSPQDTTHSGVEGIENNVLPPAGPARAASPTESTTATAGSNEGTSQLLRRQSSGRRSGRDKRHTIAHPPTIVHPPASITNTENITSSKKCVSPLCQLDGLQVYGGFCKNCFDWMLLKFMQIDLEEEAGGAWNDGRNLHIMHT